MKANNKPKAIFQSASIENHRLAWDFVADRYAGGTSLPSWGPRGELNQVNILPDLNGKKILEIGFGSGDSIIYMLRKGAGHVTGIDFSPAQLNIAQNRIRKAFKGSGKYLNKVKLQMQPMDDELPGNKFDCIVAIYGVGWSEHPEQLFRNIYRKLKPNGYFCFSWDHYMSRIVEQTENGLSVRKSYHDPMPLVREDWKGSGLLIETHQLRPSDWFQMLVNAGFTVDGFWEPKPDKTMTVPKICSNTYSPAVSEMVPNCVVFRAKKL